MNEYLNEIVGWTGAGAFVLAYLLLSVRVLSPERVTYHFINALGGILMSVSTFNLHDRPAFFVNIIWMGIALFSMFRILRLSRHPA